MTASTDLLILSYAEESTFAEAPATALQNVRYTSESLKQTTNTEISKEIRGDRQKSDVKRTRISAEGTVGIELSITTFDDWLSAVIGSAGFDTGGQNTGTLSSSTAGTFTGISIEAGIAVGDWVRAAGFSATVDGVYKVTAVASGTLTVQPAPAASVVGDADETIDFSATAANGIAKRSFTFEKFFQDLTNVFENVYGCVPGGMNLTIATESIMTGDFQFVGAFAESNAATVGTGANIAATGTDVLAAVDEIVALYEGDTLAAFTATEVSISINGNARTRINLGENSASSFGLGSLEVTGTITAYFSTVAMFDKYLNGTESALAFVVKDEAGNHLVIDLPRIKFTDGQRLGGGENTDIMAELTFTAFRDAAEDISIRFATIAA